MLFRPVVSIETTEPRAAQGEGNVVRFSDGFVDLQPCAELNERMISQQLDSGVAVRGVEQ
jgi:hypothetical protein